jgi:hypothetical protein
MDRRKKTYKNDVLLLAGMLLAGVILFVAVGAAKAGGARADVVVNGKVAESYPLNVDREVELNYSGHNLLRIENGRAQIVAADCPDKLCMKQGAIAKTGETIVCLPHRVIIRVSGGEAPDIDGVSR